MQNQINKLYQQAMQLKNNPSQYFGDMQGVDMSNPNAIIQHLMNNGKISQAQYNAVINRIKPFM